MDVLPHQQCYTYKSHITCSSENRKVNLVNSKRETNGYNTGNLQQILEIVDSQKRQALVLPSLIMGLCKIFRVDIIEHHHIRKMSKLDEVFISDDFSTSVPIMSQ